MKPEDTSTVRKDLDDALLELAAGERAVEAMDKQTPSLKDQARESMDSDATRKGLSPYLVKAEQAVSHVGQSAFILGFCTGWLSGYNAGYKANKSNSQPS